MRKFIVFNTIVFFILLIVFLTGLNLENHIRYDFSGNSFLNPVNSEYYYFTGIILQVFSLLGILIQLVFVSKKVYELK